MNRISTLIFTVLLLFAAIFLFVGQTASVTYTKTVSEVFDARPQAVWEEMLDVKNMPQKKIDVLSVDILSQSKGLLVWRENLRRGERVYEVIEKRAPRKLVVELTESNNSLRGTWTYTLRQKGSGTLVTITEDSSVTNFFFRALHTLQGRDLHLIKELKAIRVGLFKELLDTK